MVRTNEGGGKSLEKKLEVLETLFSFVPPCFIILTPRGTYDTYV